MKKFLMILFIAVVFVATAIGIGFGYFIKQYSQSTPSKEAVEIIYEVTQGKSFMAVARDLETSGIIVNAKMFSIYAKFSNMRSQMKAGEYLFRTNMNPDEVLNVLISGKSIERKITIPEGLNIYEISQLLDEQKIVKEKDFLRLIKDQKFIESLLGEKLESLEGYLYPETYLFTKFTTAEELIGKMVKQALENYNEVVPDGKSWIGSRHAFFTFSSLVEKESGSPEDRPLVASVFKNRINKKMRLQTDPTILYGIADLTGVLKNNITKEDILSPNRYNTYTIDGLPPGPIANPGIESMRAALNPSETNFLYFVSRNDGTTQFSENLQEHNSSVKKFQIDPKARDGKSWRDLKKKK